MPATSAGMTKNEVGQNCPKVNRLSENQHANDALIPANAGIQSAQPKSYLYPRSRGNTTTNLAALAE
jgi:hypothetical protein